MASDSVIISPDLAGPDQSPERTALVAQQEQLRLQIQALDKHAHRLDLEEAQINQEAQELERRIRHLAQEDVALRAKLEELKTRLTGLISTRAVLEKEARGIGGRRSQIVESRSRLANERQALKDQIVDLQARLSRRPDPTRPDLPALLSTPPGPQPVVLTPKAQAQASQAAEAAAASVVSVPAPVTTPPSAAVPIPAPVPSASLPGGPAPGARQQRVPVNVEISFSTESNFYTGISENISEGGVFIATTNHVPLGTLLDLTVTLPGSAPIQTLGTVRWVREYSQFTADFEPGIGVQFEFLGEEQRLLIEGFLGKRQPLLYET